MHSIPIRSLLHRLLGAGGRATRAARIHLLHAREMSAASRHADALAACQRALGLDPDCAEAHYRLGIIRRDLQDFTAAAASYRRAIALKPDYIEAHNNLGAVFQLEGRLEEARECYRRAVELKPDFGAPYMNLGRLCEILGDRDAAAHCFERAIAANVEPDAFRHLLNAAQGVVTDRAPAAYARTVFDNFAADFERHLVADLGYRIPQILGERVKTLCGPRKLRMLDLGCGTGLCGASIRDACELLVGVDLSPAMLARAGERHLYDKLVEMDVAEYLPTLPAAAFDAVLAADVFIYLGELTEIFTQVARVLAAGGIFAFSIERANDDRDFALQPSGRYCQSADYIRSTALGAGFTIALSFDEIIRGAPGAGTPGHVYFLQRV